MQKEDKNSKHNWYAILMVPLLLGLVFSCASIGRPEGGPIDETPPRFVRSNPSPGGLNVTRTRIVVEFDEYIKLDKPNEKIVISPPQVRQPEIKQSGKSVSINLLDTLKANTTYTIDFADGIADNNEGNVLEEFSISFSTGDVIDTMAISGYVLEASNLEPVKGILVGLHSNLEDSAFLKLPFDRVGRTDSRGRYNVRGVAPGTYRVYALMDADQNFAFTQKSEAIAFYDSLVIPRMEQRIKHDTIWRDTLTIDTIIERTYTHYLPDDIILHSFKEEPTNQYLIKSERLEPHKFTLFFAVKADTLPELTGLNFDETNAFIIEDNNRRNDTITYWIRDSLIFNMDTLAMELRYLYTDTLDNLVPRTDTLRLATRRSFGNRGNQESTSRRNKKDKDNNEDDTPPTVFLSVKPEIPSSMDVYGEVALTFEEPLASIDTSMIHLRQKIDTLWHDIPYMYEQDSINIRKYIFYTDWESRGEYEFSMDSTAIVGLYGLHTDNFKQTFRIKSDIEDYGEIFFDIQGVNSPAFVELLNMADNVVRKVPVINGEAKFYLLNPGKYGARLIIDRNENGVWDTGNFELGIQPEEVYYYWQTLELKAYQTFTGQIWDIRSRSLENQKPEEMKKQKPEERKSNTYTQNRGSGNNQRR